MRNGEKIRIWIPILAVLLALALIALVVLLVLGRDSDINDTVSPGNRIGPPAASSAGASGPDAPGKKSVLIRPRPLALFGAAPEPESLVLTGESGGEAIPFAVTGMMPGDTVSKTFTVTVNEPYAQILYFSAEYEDKTVYSSGDVRLTRSAALMPMQVKVGDKVLYDGPFGNVPEQPFAVNGPKTLTYTVTVSLDTKAGNEFADLDLRETFVWKLSYENEFTVTYTDGCSSAVFADQVYRAKLNDPTPVFSGATVREGYVFDKWTPTPSATVTGDAVYTATWIPRRTVNFVVDAVISTAVTVNDGTAVRKIYAPKKAGCGFAGWYLDEAHTQKYDFSAPVTQDLVLYARFFLWGDVNEDGYVTSFDADLVHAYVIEIPNPAIKNIMASCVNGVSGTITANNADYIQNYIIEAINEFPVERYVGYEYDLENHKIIPPIA